MKARSLWLKVHMYLGLTVGLLIAFISVTGSLLVFDHRLDELGNPDLLISSKAGMHQPLADILVSAPTVAPESVKPAGIGFPRHGDGVYSVLFLVPHGVDGSERFLSAHVDPVTAQILGSRYYGDYAMSFIFDLHYSLLAGATGQTIVGVSGAALLLLAVTGIYAWWPL